MQAPIAALILQGLTEALKGRKSEVGYKLITMFKACYSPEKREWKVSPRTCKVYDDGYICDSLALEDSFLGRSYKEVVKNHRLYQTERAAYDYIMTKMKEDKNAAEQRLHEINCAISNFQEKREEALRKDTVALYEVTHGVRSGWGVKRKKFFTNDGKTLYGSRGCKVVAFWDIHEARDSGYFDTREDALRHIASRIGDELLEARKEVERLEKELKDSDVKFGESRG